MKDISLEYKFRILIKGEKIFGQGPCRLLERVEELGSLKRACESLNMSYSKGWKIINKAEKALGYKLLQSQVGGIEGGGSHLTQEAKKIIKSYRAFEVESKESLENIFIKYFKNF